MNILGVIPARGGSKRLKNKNILPVAGKPMLCHTIEHARKSRLINRLVCSTDDSRIADVAAAYGCDVIKRPKRLAGDRSRIEDALIHAMEHLERKCGYAADIVVILLPNMPIRKDGAIDEIVRKLIKTNADSVFTVECVGKFHPFWMVRKGYGDRMLYYKKSPVFRGQDLPALYINNGAVWAVWSSVLKRNVRRSSNYSQFGKDIRVVVQERYDSVDIDDMHDLMLAESILRRGKKG